MRNAAIVVAALAVLVLAGGAYLETGNGGGAPVVEAGNGDARVRLHDAAGNPVGVAKLTEEDGDVLVRVNAHGLTPGFHGFHVHATGVCAAPFTTAGGHFNAGTAGHPGHSGDMPVLLINADGTGEARFKTDRFAISDLFDADGSAIIVHAGVDNYANIPTRYSAGGPDATTLGTGDAGARAACGVVEGG